MKSEKNNGTNQIFNRIKYNDLKRQRKVVGVTRFYIVKIL